MSTMTRISRGVAATGVAGLMSLGLATTAFADPPTGSDANHPENWEAYLVEEGYENPMCEKIHDEGLDTGMWTSDDDYVLVVLKYSTENDLFWEVEEGDELMTGSGQDISHVIACTADMDEETPTPTPTPTTSTPTSTPTTTPTSTPTTTPTTTPTSTPTTTPTTTPTSTPTTTTTPVPPPSGPVVETDVPATSGGSLPVVFGGAAVLAGLGLAAGAMRRKGQH